MSGRGDVSSGHSGHVRVAVDEGLVQSLGGVLISGELRSECDAVLGRSECLLADLSGSDILEGTDRLLELGRHIGGVALVHETEEAVATVALEEGVGDGAVVAVVVHARVHVHLDVGAVRRQSLVQQSAEHALRLARALESDSSTGAAVARRSYSGITTHELDLGRSVGTLGETSGQGGFGQGLEILSGRVARDGHAQVAGGEDSVAVGNDLVGAEGVEVAGVEGAAEGSVLSVGSLVDELYVIGK